MLRINRSCPGCRGWVGTLMLRINHSRPGPGVGACGTVMLRIAGSGCGTVIFKDQPLASGPARAIVILTITRRSRRMAAR
jgi:hypothetical protein